MLLFEARGTLSMMNVCRSVLACAALALAACGGIAIEPADGGNGGAASSGGSSSGSSGGGVAGSSSGSPGSPVGDDDSGAGETEASTPIPSPDSGTSSFDASLLDSALPDSSGSPIETFELIIDGAVQTPRSCPTELWNYSGTSGQPEPLDYIRNTGSVPLAYIAAPVWTVGLGTPYTPGETNPAGPMPQEAGILAPGASLDITAIYEGGYVALLGASKPFSAGGGQVDDEGAIPWPAGVPDSTGASTMFIAQVYVNQTCGGAQLWQ